jgi:hypothetical protein
MILPLLIELAGVLCIVVTRLHAPARSLPLLFVGRA